MSLSDKTIIITGASSGIGAAAARLFAEQGANLVLGARRNDRLAHLVDEIGTKGGKAVHLAGDVRRETYAADLVDLAMSQFGGLDGAFNNAGVIGDMVAVPEMGLENWNQVLEVNLTAAFLAAKHQIPAMNHGNGGALVFTSSFVGHTRSGFPGMAAYAAAKAGLIGLTRSLAADHGSRAIRVNALLPGGTKTEMAGEDPDVLEAVARFHALNRMAEPLEIAECAGFLLSDAARFITGAALLCDGGVSVKFG